MAKMRELERRFERTRTSFPISVLIFWERWFNDDLTKKSEKIVEGKKKQVIKSMKLSILIEI